MATPKNQASASFDKEAFKQRLIAEGTHPDTATDIATKMAEARIEQKKQAQEQAKEEEGPLLVGQYLDMPANAAEPKKPQSKTKTVEPAAAKLPRQQRKKGVLPVPREAFTSPQLTLFQTFLANDDTEREILSNAIDLWDSIPRYSLTRRKQDELRMPGGYLPIRKLSFQYKSQPFTAVIRPARLEKCDAQGVATGGTVEYYPSAREELIEHALRRLATEQAAGFFDEAQPRSGLYFTLYRLRQELAAQGHSMTHRDLAEGLDVLSLSTLDIETASGDDHLGIGKFGRSPFIVNLVGVKREDLDRTPEARWYLEFHPFVTASIDKITYRQFNYQRWMSGKTQLTRWLLSQLVLKYTQASFGNTFAMKFSTIKRDSGLLEGYKLQRQAVAALDDAWDELINLGVLTDYDKDEERGARQKLEDVSYKVKPSHAFAKEQRAANRRQLDAKSVAEHA